MTNLRKLDCFCLNAGGQAASPIPALTETTNTHASVQVLYTDYVFLFQGAGLILLVAMIGAIVLTPAVA